MKIGVFYRPVCGAVLCTQEHPDLNRARELAATWSRVPICEGHVVELERVERLLDMPDGSYRSSLMVGDEWRPWDPSEPEERCPSIAYRDGAAVFWREVQGAHEGGGAA